MNRRGFFGRLAGLAGATVLLRKAPPFPEIPEPAPEATSELLPYLQGEFSKHLGEVCLTSCYSTLGYRSTDVEPAVLPRTLLGYPVVERDDLQSRLQRNRRRRNRRPR